MQKYILLVMIAFLSVGELNAAAYDLVDVSLYLGQRWPSAIEIKAHAKHILENGERTEIGKNRFIYCLGDGRVAVEVDSVTKKVVYAHLFNIYEHDGKKCANIVGTTFHRRGYSDIESAKIKAQIFQEEQEQGKKIGDGREQEIKNEVAEEDDRKQLRFIKKVKDHLSGQNFITCETVGRSETDDCWWHLGIGQCQGRDARQKSFVPELGKVEKATQN